MQVVRTEALEEAAKIAWTAQNKLEAYKTIRALAQAPPHATDNLTTKHHPDCVVLKTRHILQLPPCNCHELGASPRTIVDAVTVPTARHMKWQPGRPETFDCRNDHAEPYDPPNPKDWRDVPVTAGILRDVYLGHFNSSTSQPESVLNAIERAAKAKVQP
jgi:hypothetical protein